MAPNVACLHKLAPKVCIKTLEDLFWRSHQKRSSYLCGRKFVNKSYTKKLSASLGKFGQKFFTPPKTCLLLHLCKGTSASIVPLSKGQKGNAPPCLHSPASLCILFYLHALSLLVVSGCNKYVTVMNANQRSPKTEQFITAKISGNVLKQGSRSHSATSVQFTTAKI